jgi:hypothetical protein
MTDLSAYGITLKYPLGWFGDSFRETDGTDDSGPVIHLGNTPLILGDRNGYAGQARQLLRPTDAVVCILNLPSMPNILAIKEAESVGPAGGWSLTGAIDTPFNGVGNNQSSLRKMFRVGERVFDMIAFFGSPAPPADRVREIEMILQTVRVEVTPRQGERLEQYFSAGAAVRIHDELRGQIWERDKGMASPAERAEHQAVPGA